MLKELRRIFFLGIFTLAPIGLTLYLLLKLFGIFDAIFQPIVRPFVSPYFDHPVPGLGVIVGILFVLLAGVMAPSLIGRQLIFLLDRGVQQVPLAKLIYSGIKQIFDSFSSSQFGKFNRVVMVKFPRNDCYSLGFVTQEEPSGWVASRAGITLAVFIPTTPNPTSGYLIFVTPDDTIPVSMSVEDAFKLVVSGGLVRPGKSGI